MKRITSFVIFLVSIFVLLNGSIFSLDKLNILEKNNNEYAKKTVSDYKNEIINLQREINELQLKQVSGKYVVIYDAHDLKQIVDKKNRIADLLYKEYNIVTQKERINSEIDNMIMGDESYANNVDYLKYLPQIDYPIFEDLNVFNIPYKMKDSTIGFSIRNTNKVFISATILNKGNMRTTTLHELGHILTWRTSLNYNQFYSSSDIGKGNRVWENSVKEDVAEEFVKVFVPAYIKDTHFSDKLELENLMKSKLNRLSTKIKKVSINGLSVVYNGISNFSNNIVISDDKLSIDFEISKNVKITFNNIEITNKQQINKGKNNVLKIYINNNLVFNFTIL